MNYLLDPLTRYYYQTVTHRTITSFIHDQALRCRENAQGVPEHKRVHWYRLVPDQNSTTNTQRGYTISFLFKKNPSSFFP